MDELRVDERLISECIEWVTKGEGQHRGAKALLEMLRDAGYRWRTPVKIVLHNGNYEADLDDEYSDYLDQKACKNDVPLWTDYKSE